MSRRKSELIRIAIYLNKRAEDCALLSKNIEVNNRDRKVLDREKSAYYSGFAKGLEHAAYYVKLHADGER